MSTELIGRENELAIQRAEPATDPGGAIAAEQSSRVIHLVSEVCDRFGIASLQSQLEACRQWLARGGELDVVVLGGFKTGKSSFLNSLAGKPVLPVGVLPVTALITRLGYGPRERATVVYLDGRREPVELDAVAGYVDESQNPGNRKKAGAVLIELPALKDYAGLCFIDTPGLGSVFAHNTETTLKWMPRIGAALVATSASHPLSERDVELMREVLRFTPKLAILLTKVDLLTGEQATEVTSFIARQLPALTPELVPVFPYSTLAGCAAYRERLDATLLLPLARGRSREHERILQHKINNLLAECVEYLEIGIAASAQEDSKRARLRDQVLGEKTDFEAMRQELRLLERHWVSQTQPWIGNLLESHSDGLKNKLTAELKSLLPAWRLNLWRFCRACEAWSQEAFTRELDAISHSDRETMTEPLRKAQTAFTRAVENFRQRLAANLEQALGIKTSRPEWECEAPDPESPDVPALRSFDIHMDSLWFLIPMRLFGGLVRRHFLRKIPWEVQINLSRLESQWTGIVNRQIHELEQRAETFVRSELATIETLLAQQPSATAAMRQARAELLHETARPTT